MLSDQGNVTSFTLMLPIGLGKSAVLPKDGFTFIIGNTVNTNRRCKKVPVESQHFFKHEKEERRSFLILINSKIVFGL